MSIKEQVKALWKLCFEDTEEFVDLYFRMRYTDRINHVIEEGGKVIAALQTIPYPMTYGGELLPVSYISGACTHPDYRNQGSMRKLLQQVHCRMFDEGICFSTLIPAEEWLKAYYARSGYAVCFRYGVEEKVINRSMQPVDNGKFLWNVCEADPASSSFAEVYKFFNERMHSRSCCIQHTLDDFKVVLADLHLSGGGCWAVRDADRWVGMVCCVPHSHSLEVKEILLDSGVSPDEVLALLAMQYGKETIEIVKPSSSSLLDLGMARVIHVETCLRRYAQIHPDEVHCIYVENDEAIPENKGYYLLEGGTCRRLSEIPQICTVYTIAELTSFLLKNESPYMSLMLN